MPLVIALNENLLDWQPDRRYDVWHHRALFHFLVTNTDRQRYIETLQAAIRAGGIRDPRDLRA